MVEIIFEGIGADMRDELGDFVITEQLLDRAAKNSALSTQDDVRGTHLLQLRQAVSAVYCPQIQCVHVMRAHDEIPFVDRTGVLVVSPVAPLGINRGINDTELFRYNDKWTERYRLSRESNKLFFVGYNNELIICLPIFILLFSYIFICKYTERYFLKVLE